MMWYDNEGFFSQLFYGIFPWLGHLFGYIYAFARMKFGNFVDFIIGHNKFGFYGNTPQNSWWGMPLLSSNYQIGFEYVNPFQSHYVDGVLTHTYRVFMTSPLDKLDDIPVLNVAVVPLRYVIQALFELFDAMGYGWLFDLPSWAGIAFFCIFMMLFLKFTGFIVGWFSNLLSSIFLKIR